MYGQYISDTSNNKSVDENVMSSNGNSKRIKHSFKYSLQKMFTQKVFSSQKYVILYEKKCFDIEFDIESNLKPLLRHFFRINCFSLYG